MSTREMFFPVLFKKRKPDSWPAEDVRGDFGTCRSYGRGKSHMGLSAHSRRNSKPGPHPRAYNYRQDSEASWDRTRTRAQSEDHLEGISRSTLGPIVATDFFTVEVWTCSGLTRFVVLFLMDLRTRRVEIGGIASSANGLWMSQIARNLTDAVNGFFAGKRYLIHDRDPLYTKDFLAIL